LQRSASWDEGGDLYLPSALKRPRPSGSIFSGIVIVAAVYLADLKFNLLLTVAMLQGFFTVVLLAPGDDFSGGPSLFL
jgi:hypothetical protein